MVESADKKAENLPEKSLHCPPAPDAADPG
jgi:hypothetical protein